MPSPLVRPLARHRAPPCLALVFIAALGAGLGAGLGGTAPASAKEFQRVRLGYDVYIGGLEMFDTDIAVDLRPAAYSLSLTAVPHGFLGRLFSWQSRLSSHGGLDGGDPQPRRHQAISRWKDEEKSITLSYDRRGTARATFAPAPKKDDLKGRVPVTPDMTRGTLDVLTGTLLAVQAIGAGEGCARTIPVFDGRRRYDVVLEDAGEQTLAKSGYSSYAGPAVACRVAFRKVAGHSTRVERAKFWQYVDGAQGRPPITVWFARQAVGGMTVPVRLTADTPLGNIVIHLNGARVGTQTAEVPK